MSKKNKAIDVLNRWYSSLKIHKDGLPAKGTVSAAIVVLGRLRADFSLELSRQLTEEGTRISGLNPSALQSILREFGETRPLTAIAGRTNPGTVAGVRSLLQSLSELKLDQESSEGRDEIFNSMLKHAVETYFSSFFDVKRVRAAFSPSDSTSQYVQDILDSAAASKKEGAVAEYLVGAKLALIYPHKNIRNKSYASADVQSGHGGDFEIGTTVFHVTISPAMELREKVQKNLSDGRRVYLLVRQDSLEFARGFARLIAPRRIEIDSVESFVAKNIDELVEFDGEGLCSGLRRLLETYNSRVDLVEMDKSLLIEIPPNL